MKMTLTPEMVFAMPGTFQDERDDFEAAPRVDIGQYRGMSNSDFGRISVDGDGNPYVDGASAAHYALPKGATHASVFDLLLFNFVPYAQVYRHPAIGDFLVARYTQWTLAGYNSAVFARSQDYRQSWMVAIFDSDDHEDGDGPSWGPRTMPDPSDDLQDDIGANLTGPRWSALPTAFTDMWLWAFGGNGEWNAEIRTWSDVPRIVSEAVTNVGETVAGVAKGAWDLTKVTIVGAAALIVGLAFAALIRAFRGGAS
jgi:hypothetical protein